MKVKIVSLGIVLGIVLLVNPGVKGEKGTETEAKESKLQKQEKNEEEMINPFIYESKWAREHISELIEAIRDPKKTGLLPWNIRYLGMTEDPRVIEPIIEVLKRNKDEDTLEAAADVLGGFLNDKNKDSKNRKRIISVLKEVLRDKRYRVRVAGASALIYAGEKSDDIFWALIELMDRPEGPGPEAIRLALKISDKDERKKIIIKNSLIKRLEDKNSWIRLKSAVFLVEYFGEKEITFPILRDGLKDKDRHVRKYAISGLEAIGNKKAIKAIKKALKDKNSSVRHKAEDALRRIEKKKKLRC